ncbi:MAG: mechanosensitive ion channel family protein [Cyanobacteriota bacterium]
MLTAPGLARPPGPGLPLEAPQSQTQAENRIDGFPVILDGQEILTIRRAISGFSAEERAQAITRRLNRIAQNDAIAVEELTIQRNADDNSVFLSVGPEVLLTITEQDAKARRSTPQALAEQVLPLIKAAITRYRDDREPRQLARNLFYALIASLAFLASCGVVLMASGQLFPWLGRAIAGRVPGIRVKEAEIISPAAIAAFWIQTLRLFRLGLLLILAIIYAAFNLRLFPWTRAVGESIMEYVYQSLELTLSAIANYLPNLFIVAIISLIAYYTLRVIKPFFTAVERGNLEIPGFYSDWARPTYNLLVILVLALATILAFPYLPGFNSPAFQGVSVFLGLLLSLGSTSAITNVIGGIILIYTRAFRIGDHIRVGDVVGDIIETNFLAVRICTPANQVITIPNATLLSNKVVNYNISSRELSRSLILQTTVTLGYDVPWRKAHDTLIDAALNTAHILRDPAPFILQTSLDNDHVSYQLNAYTDDPNMMVFSYSLLHQSIQDKCNENGIEILSPNYTALRDGNHSTTPAEHLPATHVAPPHR